MRSFKGFLNEEKNTHMEHLEDNVLNAGYAGARQAIDFLKNLRDTLDGKTKNKVNLSVKWDGAPAVFAGIDPSDGKFFVAKKGIFNKNPKVYKTPAEIDVDTDGDLATKLKDALRYLPKLGIKGVIQGDFLFSKKDLKVQTIAGEKFLTFHPNTIIYAVPVDSVTAKQIKAAKIGIVWHTSYSGKDFSSMKATYNKALSLKLKPSKDVWFTDAIYRDVSGTTTMTAGETDAVDSIMSEAESLLSSIEPKTLNSISNNEELLILVKTYNNSKVRAGEKVADLSAHVDGLVDFISSKFAKEAEKRKSESGKAAIESKKNVILGYLSNTPKSELVKVFKLMNVIVDAKHAFVKKLNAVKNINTYLSTNAGFKKTGHEGFVVSDHLNKNAVKLVDRYEFSYANFSPEVLKGWQR